MVHLFAPLAGAFLFAGALLDAAGAVLDKAYQAVMIREIVVFGRDFLVFIGVGHVVHVQRRRRRLRRAAKNRRPR